MLKTFNIGGIHPPDNKLSAGTGIKNLPLPKTVLVPINQHIGAPTKPIVARNEKVVTGQLIATAGGFVSANIHSPVTGTVVKIEPIIDNSGYRRDAIIIDTAEDIWAEGIDTSTVLVKEFIKTKEEIINKIKEAGIVGLGGAAFPAHVKLSLPEGKKAEYLVINGVECEPYLTSDHALMLEKSEEILVGASILMKALDVTKCIIGIENNKPDAIQKLTSLAKTYQGISIQPLKVKYPQGGERQLMKATINRELPAGRLPIEVGAVVFNVSTVFAVYEAVQKNKPLIERIVTVTGQSLFQPQNFRVRFGTPVKELVEAAGGFPEDTGKVINGGPMMGKAMSTIESPVVKGCSGILIMSEKDSKRKERKDCIRCGKCIDVCSMGLEPYLLMTVVEKKLYDRAEEELVMNCLECGSCSYICPSGRPMLDYIRLGKTEVGKIIRSRKS